MKLHTLFKSMVFIGLLLTASCKKDDDDMTPTDTSLNNTDIMFMALASQANTAQMDLGKLARARGQNELVSKFGQLMVTEHGAAKASLDALAAAMKINLVDGLNPAHLTVKQELMELKGSSFDGFYMASQVSGYTSLVALFQKEIKEGQIPEVKAYASRFLPQLEARLQMAITIEAKLSPNPKEPDENWLIPTPW